MGRNLEGSIRLLLRSNEKSNDSVRTKRKDERENSRDNLVPKLSVTVCEYGNRFQGRHRRFVALA